MKTRSRNPTVREGAQTDTKPTMQTKNPDRKKNLLRAPICVFLPAFLMTLAAGSSFRRFRTNRQMQAFLRGVAPAVTGLLAAAAWSIARAGIHTIIGASMAMIILVILLRFRPNTFWVLMGAGVFRFLL